MLCEESHSGLIFCIVRRSRDLHCDSRSTAGPAGSWQNKSASLHLPRAGWGWSYAGHGVWASDQKDCWADQGKHLFVTC